MRATAVLLSLAVAAAVPPSARAAVPLVLVDHLGYERGGPKRAVIQGHKGDAIRSCALVDAATGRAQTVGAPAYAGPVARWRDWVYWTVDFSSLQAEGTFRLACATSAGEASSSVFRIEDDLLERHTLSDVVYYFKGQRASGLLDAADRALKLEGRSDRTVDAHGGWYDATGDYGKHLSHLSYSTYFNPQQIPLTTWALLETYDRLQRRSDPLFRQYLRRILDEGAWGADYLVRVKAPGDRSTGPSPRRGRPSARRTAASGATRGP